MGTTMAVRRNLFPRIRMNKGAMNSIKLATPICLISCIQMVAVLDFFRHSQAICYIYIILREAKCWGGFWV